MQALQPSTSFNPALYPDMADCLTAAYAEGVRLNACR
jgi:hypothetical protein